MTVQTLAPGHNPFLKDPEYFEGRADAYDDSRTRTNAELTVLAGMAADYAALPYAVGYMDAVLEHRQNTDAITLAQTDQAQTWLARKQGRETSTLHTANAAVRGSRQASRIRRSYR